MRTRSIPLALLAALAALAACGIGDTPFGEVDPASIPDKPTWTADVAPRLDFYCAGCHSQDSFVGASGGYEWDVYDSVVGAIVDLERVAMIERSMPPGALRKLTPRDWAIIKRWSETGATR